jgi:hypothetical protein
MPRNFDGSWTAESKGRCAKCCGIIEPGDRFYWRGSAPAETVCDECRNGKRGANLQHRKAELQR